MNLFTPVEIEVLRHYYYSPDPHPRHHTPAVSDAINKFRRNDIFTDQVHPNLTDRGVAWLKLILNTPYPKKAYTDQYGNLIKL